MSRSIRISVLMLLSIMVGMAPAVQAEWLEFKGAPREVYYQRVIDAAELHGDEAGVDHLQRLAAASPSIPPDLTVAMNHHSSFATNYHNLQSNLKRAMIYKDYKAVEQWRIDQAEADLALVAWELQKGRAGSTVFMSKYLQDAAWALNHHFGITPRDVAPPILSSAPKTSYVDCPPNLVGPAGPAGPQGPAGIQGATGYTGPAGVALAGPQGAQGPAGPAGERGPRGETGAIGAVAVGPAGAAGPSGLAGAQGERGATGVQGASAAGYAGPTGPAGPAGVQGPSGTTGERGPTLVGPSGPAGARGVAGVQGVIGDTGNRGITTAGTAGPRGSAGVVGTQGSAGPKGVTGPVGALDCWMSYRDFWFDGDEVSMWSSDAKRAEEIASYLEQNPSIRIGIDHYTLTDASRQDLHNRRVNAVRSALIRAGIPTSRIETGPIGNPANRRDARIETMLMTSTN